jgi:hypothetical protein
MLLSESQDREGKRVTMTVYLGSKPNPLRMTIEVPVSYIPFISIKEAIKIVL